jgi:signal transduction histidine kinase
VSLSPTPVYLDADSSRLVQVVSNLLNNAARYTPEGGHINLTASCEQGFAVIRVRDDGIGIAPEMLDRVFERFVQLDRERPGGETGLGIGLSLVKAIIDLHGGTVVAESAGVGRGSEFTVKLPVMKSAVLPTIADVESHT